MDSVARRMMGCNQFTGHPEVLTGFYQQQNVQLKRLKFKIIQMYGKKLERGKRWVGLF